MFGHYLKLSGKVIWWHFVGQAICMAVGFISFGLLMLNFRIAEIFASVLMTGGYAIFMYSKLYKVGERDTKSYSEAKPYPCKGIVLYIGVLLVGVLLALLYDASFTAPTFATKILLFCPFRVWGYSYIAFLKAADLSISVWFWILYFAVPLCSCAIGYYGGMRRWDLGYVFFKNMVFRKKQ